jgi:hypothetical protein
MKWMPAILGDLVWIAIWLNKDSVGKLPVACEMLTRDVDVTQHFYAINLRLS